jgi:Kef-type K+ transport system membrane component KefB
MTYEIWILSVLASLVIVPRLLLRFGIPAPLTAFAMGVAPIVFGYPLVANENWMLLATLGITSLFLHAGIEVNLEALVKEKKRLIAHLAVKLLLLIAVAGLIMYLNQIEFSLAVLVALAIVTPSTGFIINTINRLQLNNKERFWVRNKAISSEILALIIMFIALQTSSPEIDDPKVLLNSFALVGLILALPMVFGFIGKVIIPHAPGSEFSLLIMMGVVAGYITKSLGVYYLVGAFLVGLFAVLLKNKVPTMATEKNLQAIDLFATFFIPFYFFVSGTRFPQEALTSDSLISGAALFSVVIPIRWFAVWVQRRFTHEESRVSSTRVSIALMPTLIFTLVISEILLSRGDISPEVFGALMVYAVMNTIIPTVLFALFGLKQPTNQEASS